MKDNLSTMEENSRRYKIVYCTPALYMAGGVERALTLKANYFAEHYGYDITIILTEGSGRPPFFPLSEKVKVVNLDIGFEQLWHCSFARKVVLYLRKQREFRRRLRDELMRLRPDITVSLLRREINFINSIPDGSRKIGELHINRANYRNFKPEDSNVLKRLFARCWMGNLVSHLRKLSRLVVLTEEDKRAWPELQNVCAIPDPLSFTPSSRSPLTAKRVIAVGRYSHEKGFDMLLQAWSMVEKNTKDWRLEVFGTGDRSPYDAIIDRLGIDRSRCRLNGSTTDIEKEYVDSSLFVLSSRFEGFGMVLVEAMACGLPVVSFDCPCGPKSIVADGEDGILVENGNVDKLAETLLRVTADGDLRRRMADKAVADVRRFDIDVLAERWRTLFDEVMDGH